MHPHFTLTLGRLEQKKQGMKTGFIVKIWEPNSNFS